MKTSQMISRSIYLESEVWTMIDEKAKEDERSGNKTVSVILKEYFKIKDKKARAKRKKGLHHVGLPRFSQESAREEEEIIW